MEIYLKFCEMPFDSEVSQGTRRGYKESLVFYNRQLSFKSNKNQDIYFGSTIKMGSFSILFSPKDILNNSIA